MQMRKGPWIGAFVLFALVGVAVFHRPILGAVYGTQASQAVDAVKDFEVTDLSGKVWKFSELQKKTESGIVCLTFWCTFCHSCRQMDARFMALAADFKDKATVIGIDASAADDAKKIEGFVREKKFSVPVFIDKGGKVADQFGVTMTTTTLVIDKAGVVRYRGQFGGDAAPHARDALKAVLAGKEAAVKETAPAG